MVEKKVVKLTYSNINTKDIDTAFREIDKYFSDTTFITSPNITVEISDKSKMLPKNLSFKKWLKYIKKF